MLQEVLKSVTILAIKFRHIVPEAPGTLINKHARRRFLRSGNTV